MALDDIHKSIKDNEFEAEFETVYGGFENGLYGKETCVFRGEQGDVEGNDEDIDPCQLVKHPPSLPLLKHLARP